MGRWGRIAGIIGAVLVGAVLLSASLRYAALSRQLDQAQNALALADSTRVIYRDSTKVVTERLAESRAGTVALAGTVGQIAKQQHETGQALIRLQVAFDSLTAQTKGQVTTSASDSTVRHLAARLDTAGVHVGIGADVPRPPSVAVVDWTVALDTLSVLQTLTRTPTGQAVWRGEVETAAGLRATAIADSVVVSREKAGRFIGVKLPTVGGAVIVGVPAILLGLLLGQL